jgi:hypothetical protein
MTQMQTWAKRQILAGTILTTLLGGLNTAVIQGASTTDSPQPLSREQALAALNTDLQAIKQKGEPISAQDLATAPIPDAQNAALDLRAAAKAINTNSPAFNTYDRFESVEMPLSPEQGAILRAMLKENQQTMPLLKSAAAKGKVDWQIKYATPMFNTLLPDLGAQRMVAKYAHVAVLLAHGDGNDVEALEHVQQLLFLARVTGQQPMLISHLVQLTIEREVFESCRQISPTLRFDTGPAMDDQLRRTINELLDETSLRSNLRYALESGRVCQIDTVQGLLSGKLTLDELMSLASPNGPKRLHVEPADVPSTILEDSRIMLQSLARNIDAATASDWPTAKTKMNPQPPPDRAQPDKHPFTTLLLPSLGKGIQQHYVGLAQRRLAAVALAVRGYALAHGGQLPPTLQDLVPKYLPAVPTDPLTAGQPLIYSLDQAIVYSVGKDGKDDAGQSDDGQSPNSDIVISLQD